MRLLKPKPNEYPNKRWHNQLNTGNYFVNSNKDQSMKVPFRVMCVAAGNWDYANDQPATSLLEVLTEYTVIEVMVDERMPYYRLQEISGRYFYAELFAILPDSSADEMQQENQESIVNIETPVL